MVALPWSVLQKLREPFGSVFKVTLCEVLLPWVSVKAGCLPVATLLSRSQEWDLSLGAVYRREIGTVGCL